MKRQGAERVMKQLEGKSLKEQLEYWQKGTEDLRRLQKKLKKTRK
jgi:exonuclease VII small subunit